MERIYLLTLLLFWRCQIGFFSVELPNLENETPGADNNQLERVELPNLMNETYGEDNNPLEREKVLPTFLNRMTHEEEENQLESEDEANMMNITQGLDDFLQQRSNRSTRTGHTYTGYAYLNGGYWGGWGGGEYCPFPHFANKMELKMESRQGGGDDTALNAIRLTCTNGQTITSAQQGWGYWRGVKSCSSNNYIKSGRIRREGSQGGGDDTAANGVRFLCTDGVYGYPGDGYWGGFHDWQNCPSGSAVYGLKTQIENDQGWGDDTALNDVILFCAKIPAIHGGWSSWGSCSISCRISSYGYQYRSCANPRPQYGGRYCSGSWYRKCNENVFCPIHGGWSSWGSCSKSCRYGTSYGYQYRSCANPRPQHGGRYCSGLSYRKCNENVCCPDNSGRMAKQTTYLPTPTKSCPTLPEPTPCPTTTCPPVPTCSTNITKPPATPSCKPSKKCEKKNGKCFGKGDTVPKHAKRKGWCSKKTNCKCYKV